MINRILRSSAIPKVRTRHPIPLQERRVVRAGAKRSNPGRALKHRFKVVLYGEALDFRIVSLPITAVVHLEKRAGGVVRMVDLVGGTADEISERGRSGGVEVGARGGDVDVEVGNDVALEKVAEVFSELGR